MGSRGAETDDHLTADNTPEDVAALYSWANLQGAKYRDYSASRREHRAQVRYRAAKTLLEREMRAQAEAEAAAAEAERIAAIAEAARRGAGGGQAEVWRAQSAVAAEKAAERAALDRVEAARRAELSARLAVEALREEREIAEAHASAERQAMLYEGSETRLRRLAGPQPHSLLQEDGLSLDLDQLRASFEPREDPEQFLFPGWQEFAASPIAEGERNDAYARAPFGPVDLSSALNDLEENEQSWVGQITPAWLLSADESSRDDAIEDSSRVSRAETPAADTLFDSREQLAARWFALKGVFEDEGAEHEVMPGTQSSGASTPLLAIFSLCGGVGKTSLAAAIARRLATLGEDVTLVDSAGQGLLPIYLGLHELRSGIIHRVEGEGGAGTISISVLDAARAHRDDRQKKSFDDEIFRNAPGDHRLIVDVATGSGGLIPRMAEYHPTVLVPIAPDINSVMSLQSVERLFRGIMDTQRRPVLPFYVLNQFDASLPLHLDIREVFRRRLGDRLARVAIRRSPAVGEALAEGMTVLKYAPDDPVAQDYIDLVAWLRSISPPASEAARRRSRDRGKR